VRYYENLFIIDPNYENERFSHLVDSVKSEAKTLGINIINIDQWGKKRLAYQIEKHKYGSYVLLQYETENGSAIQELEKWMEITNGILAYQTIVLDAKPEVKKED